MSEQSNLIHNERYYEFFKSNINIKVINLRKAVNAVYADSQ